MPVVEIKQMHMGAIRADMHHIEKRINQPTDKNAKKLMS